MEDKVYGHFTTGRNYFLFPLLTENKPLSRRIFPLKSIFSTKMACLSKFTCISKARDFIESACETDTT